LLLLELDDKDFVNFYLEVRTMTQIPSVPPFIESNDRDYHDSGVPSTFAIAGHPLHPLIVTFPIAFLSGAAGADLGYWLTDDPFWARAAIWLIGAGFISGLVAALTGMLDFLRIDSHTEQLSRRKRRLIDERNFVGCVGFHSSTQPTDPCTEPISAKFLRRGYANESASAARAGCT
jgi:hypothetical protein